MKAEGKNNWSCFQREVSLSLVVKNPSKATKKLKLRL
jgi:hypothetical protein